MKLVSVETPEKSVCKMTFSATAEELETASNAVYERTRASYTIKGFAKGEADRAQIEADRGEHTFWYDAINDLMDRDVPALYEAAMAEHGFKAVDEPSYDLVSVKKDEGFVATATTPLQPELNLTQTTGFHVECVTPAVTDKEIDAVLERRRNAAAELVPHKGPAVKGNIVHIDYEGLLDGKPFQGGSAQNQPLQLGSGRMIPGFEDGILGHKGGEEFEINVTFPVRYHVKDLAGKPVVFKIKLIDVCVRQLPALNSDFAKKVGKVDTMEAFREQVRKQLHDGKHASALNRAKDQVLTQLASAAEGELPSVLVESTYQQEMQNIQQQLQMQRMSLDRYLSQIHQTRENFTANVHAAAEKNTRARMALLQVAQNEGLVPTDEEITKNLQERADRTKKTLEEVKATATTPLQPELNLTQTTGFHVECVTPAVTDKEIDAVLERRRNAAAELVPHKGPAVKGNIVHIDYEGLLDGKPFQGGSAQNQPLQLGSGRMIPGFEDGILGHKGGEEFEINVTFPVRYHVKDLAGKPVVFKIKLIDVCVRQLPALNSDFAKKVGKVDTMEAFREQVRKQLHDGKHASALNRAKDQVLTQLASAAEGELPSVLVESTYQQEMQNIQQQLQMQRMSLDRYLSQIHQTRENFTANVHAAAEKNTRARMALLQVAQNEGLVPTDEEITKNLQERADRTKKTLEEVKANANIPAMQRSEAIRRAADWVIEHSTIEEK